MIKLFFTTGFLIVPFLLFSQDGKTKNYPTMDTIQMYAVNTSYYADIYGKEEFFVNDIQVDKLIYEKYISIEKTQNCCPCVIEYLTINDTLLSRITECNSCKVGDYATYYSNGNIKCLGKYKQNTTENWQSLRSRELCDIKTSEWIYFDVNGDTLYIEKWNNGEFISQNPDQNSDDIWGIDFELNGQLIQENTITLNEFNQLVLKPKYKSNNQHPSINIHFDLSIYSSAKEGLVFTDIPYFDLTNIDLINSIKSTDLENKRIEFISIKVYQNNELIQYQKFQIEE
jgi:hypothetical protein